MTQTIPPSICRSIGIVTQKRLFSEQNVAIQICFASLCADTEDQGRGISSMLLSLFNLNITTIIITINHHHHHNAMNHPHHQHCASWKAVIDSHDGAREKVPDDWGVIQTICQRCILACLIITILMFINTKTSSLQLSLSSYHYHYFRSLVELSPAKVQTV